MKKNNVMQNIRPVILSAHSVILSAAKNLFLLAVIAGLTGNLLASCQKDLSTEVTGGKLKNEAQLDAAPSILLRTPKSLGGIVYVVLTKGTGYISEPIYATSLKPTELSQTIVLQDSMELLEEFSKKSHTIYKPLPKSFFCLEDEQLTIKKNDVNSNVGALKIFTQNTVGNTLEAGRYLLPIVAHSSSQKVATHVYYDITVREPFEGDAGLTQDEISFVFYINTDRYNPLLVTDYYLQKMDFSTFSPAWYSAIGNIVNLRTSVLDYDDKADNARLVLNPDLRYVLDHANKYITPIQESGRKVCITIEGSNKGYGFCNMNDYQINSLSIQIKQILNQYHLDGVNLWDKNSGYGKGNFPSQGTTSYPKLIKKLRETLGSEMLITLVDYEEPTESFYNLDATGGIKVGDYIDYAWSGYNNHDEGYQLIDPYHQEADEVSKIHPRKPILGLSPDRYGCINVPWMGSKSNIPLYDATAEAIKAWCDKGYKPNNIIVYEDLRTNLQDEYEGIWSIQDILIPFMNPIDCIYIFDGSKLSELEETRGYGKWLKDW